MTAIGNFLLDLLSAFFNTIHHFWPVSPAMTSKAAPANADVAYANYKTFNNLNIQVRESLRKAIEEDEKRSDKAGVILLYKKVRKLLNAALAISPSSCPGNKQNEVITLQDKLYNFLAQTEDRLQKLEELHGQKLIITRPSSAINVPSQPCSSSSHPVNKPFSISKSLLLTNVNPKFGEEILSTLVETTDTRLADIEGNTVAKAALEESIVLPAMNPTLFTGLRAPCKGILLFGPPGNGKTMLAKAVANESGCRFFNVSAATIMSKWVGDGERLVQALFQVARNAQPSIIFIDEVDSMLCERSEQENGATRRVKTEFLVQLDGCLAGKSNDRVLVLAATNRPQELDEGILRRFPQRILIDLPDAKARAKMIRRTFELHNIRVQFTAYDLEYIASRTENYSYSDLMSLCRAASLIPVQNLKKEDLRHCSADKLRPINVNDLEAALLSVKPSINLENRKKLQEFATTYAQMPV